MAAKVGGVIVTKGQVTAILEHAREEAKREGKEFPAEGTSRYRLLRRQALDLLVYHLELEQTAKVLGTGVSKSEVQAALRRVGGSTEGGKDQGFREESIRGALLYQRIRERVTRNVAVTQREIRAYYRSHLDLYRLQRLSLAAARSAIRLNLLETKRNAIMSATIAQMTRLFSPRVTYAAEFR